VEHRGDQAVHPLHWAHQFDFRLHDFFCYAPGVPLLGPGRACLFQTGWFVESLMTQTLIIHVIRTNKIPFIQSQASRALTFTTLSIMAFGIWLPYSPLASPLGFTHLPTLYWPILVVTMFALWC
jgi:Mg2+-importing ATPase